MVARLHSAARSMFWWMMLSAPIATQGVCPNMSAVTTGTKIEITGFEMPLSLDITSSTGTIGTLKLQATMSVQYELSNSQGKLGSLEQTFGKDIHMFDCDNTKIADVKVKHKSLAHVVSSVRHFEIFDGQGNGSKVAILDFDDKDPAYYKLKLPDGTDVLQVYMEYKNWLHRLFPRSSFKKATVTFYPVAMGVIVPPVLKDHVFLGLLAGFTMAPAAGLLSYIIQTPIFLCCCCCCCWVCCCRRRSAKKTAVAPEEVSSREAETLLDKPEQAPIEDANATKSGLCSCCSRGTRPPQGNMQP